MVRRRGGRGCSCHYCSRNPIRLLYCSDNSVHEDEPQTLFTTAASTKMTHTVKFKCIGCTRDPSYQETLAQISKQLGEGTVVSCIVEAEPLNPIDSRALAFKCFMDKKWHRIGYVVKEAVEKVHSVLQSNDLVSVGFEWIQFRIFPRNPGWYAGINITRYGEWSQTMMASQSSKPP